ncbi:hypothetical protein ElyMa_005439100 [Elysia marginata]|uniref:Uncharacterized protein n=1 Tax=Elysia marginata TaxID=1093978 RepID=A0AAV4ELL1_9GAST|nr:hypothetical protein ElyMa_005439100 [Elysia marginata]
MNNRFLLASASSRHTRGRNNQRKSANTVRRRLSTSAYVLVAHASAPSWPSVTETNVRYVPRNMPLGISSNGEVSYSVTNLNSALTMLIAVNLYEEQVMKDTKQIALGNTTDGVEHL